VHIHKKKFHKFEILHVKCFGSVVEKIGAAVLISVETATCNDY